MTAGIGALLDQQMMEAQKLHCSKLMKQLLSLRYLARQGLLLRGHEQIQGNQIQLLLLHSEGWSELKQWVKEKHYYQVGWAVTIQLLKSIHEASIYFLIADEATDITNIEQFHFVGLAHFVLFLKTLLSW